jgi:hypothetical protein
MRIHHIVLLAATLIAIQIMPRIVTASPVPITVNNFSFETPDLVDGGANAVVPSWTPIGAPGTFDPQDPQFAGTTLDNANTSGTLPDGGQIAIITTYFNGALSGGFTQSVGTVAANTIYTLTVGIGTRADLQSGAWTIALLAGTTVLASDSANSGPAGGTFVDHTALAGPLTLSDPSVGQSLIIRVTGANAPGNAATAQDAFDDVRLTAEAVPEPASVGLFGVAIVAAAAHRRRGQS